MTRDVAGDSPGNRKEGEAYQGLGEGYGDVDRMPLDKVEKPESPPRNR